MMDSDHVLLTHPYDFFRFKNPAVVPSTCFVLMPFAKGFDIVYEEIVDALQGLMTCTRADDIADSAPILERVLRGIATAELIVADLTGRNANVFYELGIAHTRTKNVLLLTQSINDVPFDLQGLHCKVYSLTSRDDLCQLRQHVRRAAEDVAARRTPSTLEGALARTREIVGHMRQIVADPQACSGLRVRVQSAISSFGNLPADAASSEYEIALEEERTALMQLAERGASIQVILSPHSVKLARDEFLLNWERRIDRVIEFLSRGDGAADRCEIVLSPTLGPNLFFFNDQKMFEGHKTGVERGFGLTMVFTDQRVLRSRIGIFDQLFESARSYTLRTYGGKDADLRTAVIRGLELAKRSVGLDDPTPTPTDPPGQSARKIDTGLTRVARRAGR